MSEEIILKTVKSLALFSLNRTKIFINKINDSKKHFEKSIIEKVYETEYKKRDQTVLWFDLLVILNCAA